jgi:hypothetical protein
VVQNIVEELIRDCTRLPMQNYLIVVLINPASDTYVDGMSVCGREQLLCREALVFGIM